MTRLRLNSSLTIKYKLTIKAPKCPEVLWPEVTAATLPVIASIINTSLITSAYPIAWKIAEVAPIPKDKEHPEVANNNRPISLLPVLSNVCERVAYDQIKECLTFKKRLSSKQSGNKLNVVSRLKLC